MAAPWVNPAGPIFISHRSTDGTDVAEALARLLRSSGLPVWLDVDDLPPGDIASRLDQAFARGLSGAVMVVTPDVGASTVIREQELPVLLALARDPDFTLAILTEVEDPSDSAKYDRHAPARLLDPAGSHPELSAAPGIKQYSRIDLTAADLGQALARRRLEVLRRGREMTPLTIDIQSRRQASAYGSTADLVFRTAPPAVGNRLPDREVWEDLQRLVVWLADVVATERPPEVHVNGGGHLSIGLAFGAALPEAAGVPIAVETLDGVFRRARRSLSLRERLPFIGPRPRRRWGPRGTGLPLAAYVDVSEFAGQPTFSEWASANRPAFSRSVLLTRIGRHDPDQGALIATAIAGAVRHAAHLAKASEVLLFLHTSWPLAVLLGTALNTLTVRTFEWDNSSGLAAYREVATVRPGVGGSVVIDIRP